MLREKEFINLIIALVGVGIIKLWGKKQKDEQCCQYKTADNNQKSAADRDYKAALSDHANGPCWNADDKTHYTEERDYRRHQKRYNWVVGVSTFLGMGAAIAAAMFAGRAFYETKRQADAAVQQTIIAREDQRPWLSLDAAIGGPIQFLGRDAAKISLTFKVKNHGRSPALNAHLQPEILGNEDAPLILQDRIIDKLRNLPERFFNVDATVFFPTQELESTTTLLVSGLDAAAVETAKGLPELRNTFFPIFAACIAYEFTFSKERHFTCVAGAIQPKTGSPYASPFDITAGDVPSGKAEINLIYGGYVD